MINNIPNVFCSSFKKLKYTIHYNVKNISIQGIIFQFQPLFPFDFMIIFKQFWLRFSQFSKIMKGLNVWIQTYIYFQTLWPSSVS